jgi:SSS family solute:Na+ symporter/sodium/proline symporter
VSRAALFQAVCLAYLVLLVAVSVWRGRRVAHQDDFMVAGRRMSTFVLIATLLATWIGTGSILGAAGLAYRNGFSALWFSAGAWAAIVILYLIAGRARAFAQYTVPDMLEVRYGPAARVLGTVVTIVAYTAVVSYQYKGGALVLNMVTGVDPHAGVLVTAVFVILYTAIAGMISVAYTDVVNGVVLLAGLGATFAWLLVREGGPAGLAAALPPEKISLVGTLSAPQIASFALPALVLLLGEAGMYQRFFSAESERAARRSVVGWIVGTIVVEALIVAIAVAGSVLVPGLDAAGATGSETIVLHVITDVLPAGLGALLLAAVMTIIVDTADSFLLVPATNVMRDLYQRFVNPELEPRAFLLGLRIAVVVLGILAWAQLSFFDTILQMALYAYTMYGAGITPAVLAAFFWRRATPAGGVASIATGMLATLAWEALKRAGAVPPALAEYDTVFFALAASVVVLVVVSLATPPPPESRWRPFFRRADASPAQEVAR